MYKGIDQTTTDDAEDLDLVISMHNLLQCSLNYSDTTVSLWLFLKIKQLILILKLQIAKMLNLSSIRLNYWETQLQIEQMESEKETQQLLCH